MLSLLTWDEYSDEVVNSNKAKKSSRIPK